MKTAFKPLGGIDKSKEFKIWAKPVVEEKDNEEELVEQQALEEEKNKIMEQAYQQGIESAQVEIQNLKNELSSLLSLVKKPLELIDKELESELLNTVLWLCKVCLKVELEQSPERITSIIEEIKPHLPAMQKDKKLLLNQSDIEFMKQFLKGGEHSDLIDIIIEDANLSRGEFRLISESSELDGRLEERLNAILERNMAE